MWFDNERAASKPKWPRKLEGPYRYSLGLPYSSDSESTLAYVCSACHSYTPAHMTECHACGGMGKCECGAVYTMDHKRFDVAGRGEPTRLCPKCGDRPDLSLGGRIVTGRPIYETEGPTPWVTQGAAMPIGYAAPGNVLVPTQAAQSAPAPVAKQKLGTVYLLLPKDDAAGNRHPIEPMLGDYDYTNLGRCSHLRKNYVQYSIMTESVDSIKDLVAKSGHGEGAELLWFPPNHPEGEKGEVVPVESKAAAPNGCMPFVRVTFPAVSTTKEGTDRAVSTLLDYLPATLLSYNFSSWSSTGLPSPTVILVQLQRSISRKDIALCVRLFAKAVRFNGPVTVDLIPFEQDYVGEGERVPL